MLAEKVGMSSRNFNRRFKQATGKTALKYLQLLRIEAAKTELENWQRTFDEISFKIGYENVSFLRRIFKRVTGLSPAAYKKIFFNMLKVNTKSTAGIVIAGAPVSSTF